MTKILLAVDGSGHDDTTIQCVARLFKGAPNVEVTIVNVAHLVIPTPPLMEIGMAPAIPSPQEIDRWENEITAEAQSVAAAGEAAARAAGLNASALVVSGTPADAIAETAEKGGYDLIALGSRGAGQVAGIFLGSVSDKVAHHSKVPVLIVHHKHKD